MKTPQLIKLPERTDYPEFYLSFHRISCPLKNTVKEKGSIEYMGIREWEPAIKLNLNLGKILGITQSTPSLADMRYSLYCLHEKKVYDQYGNKLKPRLQKSLFDEIIKKRNPSRGEWIDNKFEKNSKESYLLLSQHEFDSSGNLVPDHKEELDPDTLMKERNIDIINWLTKNYTPQGLPNKNVKEGRHYYRPPTGRGYTVQISGSSNVVFIPCDAYPFDRFPNHPSNYVGVRSKFLNI